MCLSDNLSFYKFEMDISACDADSYKCTVTDDGLLQGDDTKTLRIKDSKYITRA